MRASAEVAGQQSLGVIWPSSEGGACLPIEPTVPPKWVGLEDISLADRVFLCQNPHCRYEWDQDNNASVNILNEALRLVGAN